MFSSRIEARPAPAAPPRRLILGAALALFSAAAAAQVTSMQVYGSYAEDGGATTNLGDNWAPNAGSVSVYGAGGHTYLRSYGDVDGNFHGVAGGDGVYRVASGFEVVRSVSNTSATAQLGYFHFNISPGVLDNTIGSPLDGGHYVDAGMSFDLRRDNIPLWSSAASLRSDATGTRFSSQGDGALYSGAGSLYRVNAAARTVELGLLAPGQTVQLSYTFNTYSAGDSVAGPGRHVDAYDFVVPLGWHSYGVCPSAGRTAAFAVLCDLYQPGEVIHIDAYDVPGSTSGARAGSGDPFDVQVGNIDFTVDSAPNSLGELSLAPVPEPSGWTMLLGGLGLVGALSARRRRSVPG